MQHTTLKWVKCQCLIRKCLCLRISRMCRCKPDSVWTLTLLYLLPDTWAVTPILASTIQPCHLSVGTFFTAECVSLPMFLQLFFLLFPDSVTAGSCSACSLCSWLYTESMFSANTHCVGDVVGSCSLIWTLWGNRIIYCCVNLRTSVCGCYDRKQKRRII